jgi:hypothetical protein
MNKELIQQHADDAEVQVQFEDQADGTVSAQIFMPNGVTRTQAFPAGAHAKTVTDWIDHDVTRFWKGEPKKAPAKKGAK